MIALGTNLSSLDKNNVAKLFTYVEYSGDLDPGVIGQMDSMMRFLTRYKRAKDVDLFDCVPLSFKCSINESFGTPSQNLSPR